MCVVIASIATVIGHQAPIIGGAVFALMIGILMRNAMGFPTGFAPGVSVASNASTQNTPATLVKSVLNMA